MKIHKREKRKNLLSWFDQGYEARMEEREYYFDEGLGQTLTDHVKELQAQMNHGEVTTRRDGDGLAIVKVSYKPNHTYDIDRILSVDPEEMELNQK